MADRRDELLDGAVAWVFDHGFAELSLRPLASALQTSDRMLLYYFGTKEQLIVEVAGRAADGLVALMPPIDLDRPPRSSKAWLDACWALFTDPAARQAMALLFEIDVLGTRDPAAFGAAATRVADRWMASVDAAMTALGVPARSRRGIGRVVGAALVGLTLDALVRAERTRPAAEIAVLARLIDDARRPT
ncbi:MAG TPA: TetR/AcrR family transcriptional regulator [Aquihabitans sp.]|nr:TetR/AcrR family transcriptional regulator [Aquihabitans sp.]